MERILIVSSNEKFGSMLTELILSLFSPQITLLQSGGEARREISHMEYDLIIINAPLSDEFGHELALLIAEDSMTGVMMLAKSDLADSISVKVEDYGVYVLPKPFSRGLFFSALKLIRASRKRMTRLRKENLKLQAKIKDIKIIDRAKCVLIEMEGMTENDAHVFLERESMNRRVTKRELAEEIIRNLTLDTRPDQS